MFSGDVVEQGNKLMISLALVVYGLKQPENIISAVQELRRRHVGYGVRDGHFTSVAHALIWTLEQGLGDAFTDDVRDAWVGAYDLLSGIMIAAMNEERASQAAPATPTYALAAPAPAEPVYESPSSSVDVEGMHTQTEELRGEIGRVGKVADEITEVVSNQHSRIEA